MPTNDAHGTGRCRNGEWGIGMDIHTPLQYRFWPAGKPHHRHASRDGMTPIIPDAPHDVRISQWPSDLRPQTVIFGYQSQKPSSSLLKVFAFSSSPPKANSMNHKFENAFIFINATCIHSSSNTSEFTSCPSVRPHVHKYTIQSLRAQSQISS